MLSPFSSQHSSLQGGHTSRERAIEPKHVQITLTERRLVNGTNRDYTQVSPTQSHMTSARSSPAEKAVNPALASKFAYGQAQTRKQTEFETVVSPKAGFKDIAERKLSGESLGRGARLHNSSSRTSDIDENEVQQNFMGANVFPVMSMSNLSKSTAQLGRTSESIKN